jgi:hypothetical protein
MGVAQSDPLCTMTLMRPKTAVQNYRSVSVPPYRTIAALALIIDCAQHALQTSNMSLPSAGIYRDKGIAP